jgi:membrane-bound lytic murein transglycosylase D
MLQRLQSMSTTAVSVAICIALSPVATASTTPATEAPVGVTTPTSSAPSPSPSSETAVQVPIVPSVGAPFADPDLWQRVRRGFVMSDMVSPLVQDQELWYANRPDYINRFVERASRYMYHIVEEVERRGMPTEIALLPIIESAFNPQAYSRAHAAGMWQFIPSTGKIYGLSQDWLTDNRRDVLLSTNAALDYLQKLYGMFNSWELAFAAYNCGEGCVARAIAWNQKRGLPTDFQSLRLPNETRAYVPKLIAVKNIVLSPGSYGIDLPPLFNRPFFAQVKAPEKIDVHLAAKLAEMELEAFQQLNPSFNKPVAATGTGYFLVPLEHADVFRENLALYQSLNGPMVSWVTVSAKRGESVDAVARKHGMSASYLRATNGPFKERKGKFTQPVTFMAPNTKDANAIRATFDQKVALKREQKEKAPTIMPTESPVATMPIALSARAPSASVVPSAASAPPPPSPPALAVASVSATPPTATTTAPQTLSVATETAAVTTAATNNVPTTPRIVARGDATPLENAAAEVPTAPTGPVTYVVQRGDTLFSIAKRAALPLNDLKALNGITNNVVAIGRVLRFPEGTLLAPAPALSAVAAAAFAGATKTAGRLHSVRPGETLSAIARKYGVSVDQLLQLNGLRPQSVLRVGQKIRL